MNIDAEELPSSSDKNSFDNGYAVGINVRGSGKASKRLTQELLTLLHVPIKISNAEEYKTKLPSFSKRKSICEKNDTQQSQ